MASRMTPRQIILVRQSFDAILLINRRAATMFYERLFVIDPSTRPLFGGDMVPQGAKLMAAIGAVVRALDDVGPILAEIRALAQRHVRYGVLERHYASVGQALLWTLEQGLRANFTDEVRGAWTKAYDILSSAMIEAAYPESALAEHG
jgi:hemoglobin-like flavoprotein